MFRPQAAPIPLGCCRTPLSKPSNPPTSPTFTCDVVAVDLGFWVHQLWRHFPWNSTKLDKLEAQVSRSCALNFVASFHLRDGVVMWAAHLADSRPITPSLGVIFDGSGCSGGEFAHLLAASAGGDTELLAPPTGLQSGGASLPVPEPR